MEVSGAVGRGERRVVSGSAFPRGLGSLVAVGVLAFGAALTTTYIPDAAYCVALAGAVIVACALGGATVRPRAWWAIVALSGAFVAAIALQVTWLSPDRAAAAAVAASGRVLVADGSIVTKVEQSSHGELRFGLSADVVYAGADSVAHGVMLAVVLASSPEDSPALQLGDRVSVSGPARAGAAGDWAAIRLRAGGDDARVTEPAGAVLRGAAELRRGFVTLAASLPGDGGALLPGLAVGDTSAVSPELDSAMKDTSLSHLTAVSGSNCAVVVALVYAVSSLLMLPRWVRIAVSALSLIGFVVLVTPEPSVIRAAAMATIALLALALDRPVAGLQTLSLAVATLLVSDPWLASRLGFVLSVAATAALLTLTRPLTHGMSRVMPRALALMIAVPLAAQLVCGPLIVLVDPAVSLYGVVANIVAAPAAPMATVLGLAACLLAGVPGLGWAIACLAWLPSAWVAATAEVFAGLPGSSLPWPEAWPGVAALALLGCALFVVVSGGGSSPRSRVVRTAAWATVAVMGGVGAGSAALGTALAPVAVPSAWRLAQCDVGQGDALVVRAGAHVAVVDTGPDSDALARCLRRLSVSRVDVLVLTHFDLDHVGGAHALLGRVGHLVHGAPVERGDDELVDEFVAHGARAVRAEAGMTGALGPGHELAVTWKVLWPRPRAAAFASGNDGSVVVELSGAGVPRTLLLGDLSGAAQRALVRSGALSGAYDAVKVAHHGSADQEPDLYRSLGPSVALIGVGTDNLFGHPRSEILEVLEEASAVVVRSDLDGLSLVWTDAGIVRVWRERRP